LHAFGTGATSDNCASILSLQYSIFWQPMSKPPYPSRRLFFRLILSQKLEIHKVFLRFFAFIRRKNCSPIRTRQLAHRLPLWIL
jgi:hypothetical protein